MNPAPAIPSSPADLQARQLAYRSSIALGPARAADARQAAEDFVSLALVEPVLQHLRESADAAPPFAPTRAERQFRALLDTQLARRIVHAGRWPLVDRLASDLRRPHSDHTP